MADNEVDKKVLDWLHKGGFPFELKVGRKLLEAHWCIAHGQPYEDPVQATLREIDLYASRLIASGEDEVHSLSFVLAIECKSNPTKQPWVALVDAIPKLRMPGIITPDSIGRALLLRCTEPDLLGLETFSMGQTTAHGLVQARLGDKAPKREAQEPDRAFKAVSACANAAVARVARNQKALLNKRSLNLVEIVLPMVVVDGPLYRYFLNAHGDEVLEQQAWIKLLWSHPVGGVFIVHVVTWDGLEAFAHRVYSDTTLVGRALQGEVNGVVKRHVERKSWEVIR